MAFTPGGFNIRGDYNYVSTFNLHKPEVSPKLARRYGSQYLTGMLELVGRKVVSGNIEYKHFEQDRIMPKITATVVGGGGAGAASTWTLTATTPLQNVSIPQTAPYIGSTLTTQGVPVRAGDIILVKPTTGTVSASTVVPVLVYSVNVGAGTFVAYPTQTGDAILTNAVAAEYAIVSGAYGEGTGMPDPLVPRTLEYLNNLQIFKDRGTWTGTEDEVVEWIEQKWRARQEETTYKIFVNKRELGLLLGKKLTNTTLANLFSATGPMKITNGLIPEILSGGGAITNYSAITGWTLADGEAYVLQLDKQRAPKEHWWYQGIQLNQDVNRELRSVTQNGGVVYGAFNGDKDLALNLNFDSVKIGGGYTFHMKIYDAFNDEQTLGAVGYNYVNEGFTIPASMGKDPKTGADIPSLAIRYLANREMMTKVRSNFEIDGTDTWNVDYQSECGLETFAINHYGYTKRA